MISSTTDLLKANEIRRAIVVDDAYDRTPKSADLTVDRDEWNIFVDDLTENDLSTLRSVYPDYAPGQEGQLFQNDDFIARLWDARDQFRPELIGPLFETYVHDSEHDLRFIKAVETQLAALDLRVRTAGRAFVEDAESADLIVIDLFLGAQQSEADMRISLEGLAQIVKRRLENPPVIILMSRSGRLPELADSFRDEARVFASGFRTIAKSEVEKPGRLEYLVWVLARYRQDSLKLNAFLLRWTDGMSGAIQRTQDDIRRLDLEDWAQIHDLLLAAEGSSAGRYILEVLEFSFLHELESEDSFLDAAAALDTLEREAYPPTTIAGSKDTLGLVAKTLYEHEKCRQLDGELAGPVAFGDIIGPIQGSEFPKDSVFAQLDNAVLITMTPACDLQTGEAPRILFMVGETKNIGAPAAGDASTGLRTPILYLPDGKRVWVDWQRNHLLTLTSDEVGTFLSADGTSVTKVARLRTANAVSLQQQLLSNLGRVGLVASMPATFPVQVAVYYPSAEGNLKNLLIDDKETIDGVCYVGRRSKHKNATASLDSIHRFDFLDALERLTDDQIHISSVRTISNVRQGGVLNLLFSRGLRFDLAKSNPHQWTETVQGKQLSLGKVVYGQSVSETLTKSGQINQVGLVFEIRDSTLNPRG